MRNGSGARFVNLRSFKLSMQGATGATRSGLTLLAPVGSTCERKKNAGRGDLSAFRVSALISCQTTTIAHACVLLSFYRLRPSVSAASAERARMTTPFLLCPAERAVLCRRCCANLRSSSAEAPSVRPDIGTSLSTVDSLANPRFIG